MRVAMLHNRYRSGQPSGENTVVDQTAEMLRAAGHDLRMYTQSSDDIARMPLNRRAGLPLRSIWSFADQREFGRRISSWRPDVVHVHNTFPLLSPSVLRVAHRAGVPVVATLHNFRLMCANGVLQRDGAPCEDCLGRVPWRAVAHGCYRESRAQSVPLAAGIAVHRALGTWPRYVTRFVAPSEFVRSRYLAGGLDPEQIVVKPHGVPQSGAVRTGPGGPVVFLGRLTEDKGFADLLRAWQPSLGELVVIGDGPLRAQAAGIRVLGELPWRECMDWVRRARAVVVPSRSSETFGLTAVEAFAHGVPVVASRIGALAELVTDRVTGALFEPGDVRGLRQALEWLVDPLESSACGARARAVYLERFTPERDLSATERIYQDAMAGRDVADASA